MQSMQGISVSLFHLFFLIWNDPTLDISSLFWKIFQCSIFFRISPECIYQTNCKCLLNIDKYLLPFLTLTSLNILPFLNLMILEFLFLLIISYFKFDFIFVTNSMPFHQEFWILLNHNNLDQKLICFHWEYCHLHFLLFHQTLMNHLGLQG